jgi:uncharacterized protein YabE (DUF348 family)/3D (Asp-Asp-Asp) domain-containing protein
LYSNKKNNNIRRADTNKKKSKSIGSHLDAIRNKFISLFSAGSKKEINRRTTKKIYDIIPENRSELSRKRDRYQKPVQRRGSQGNNKKKSNLLSTWFKKNAFIIGKVKISRLGLTCTLCILLALASGSFALASSLKENRQAMASNTDMMIESEGEIKTLFLTYDNKKTEINTKSTSINEVLKENNIVLGENDRVEPALDSAVIPNMHIDVINEFPVKVIFKGTEEKTIKMTKGTVATALKEAGIKYDDDDRITPEPYTKLYNGIEIRCDKVEIKKITEEQVIKFEKKEEKNKTIEIGLWDIKQKGKNGKKQVTTSIIYINDVEDSREIIEETITKKPITQIKLIGTAKKSVKKDTSTDKDDNDKDNDKDDGKYDKVTVKNPKEQATNPSVPASPGSYVKKQVCYVTAYTHTGRTPATGTWPRSTRTLENPGSCAVVPSTFPYGTLFYVPGYGYCLAEDTGGFRKDPNRKYQIDLFMNTKDECMKWGRKRSWEVFVLRIGYP